MDVNQEIIRGNSGI